MSTPRGALQLLGKIHAALTHLAEIARHVDADAHAILIMDQAGWHMSNNLVVPENITILPLPPKSPELNPVENLWHFMRDNWLSNVSIRTATRYLRARMRTNRFMVVRFGSELGGVA